MADATTGFVTVNEELEAAFQELASQDVETRCAALTTLKKLTENAHKNQDDLKFRSVKCSNAAFTKKVVDCPGGVEAMVACGWMPDNNADGEDIWTLSDETVKTLALPLKRFEEELAKLPAPASAAPVVPTAPAAGLAGMGGMPGMPGMGMPGMGMPGMGMPGMGMPGMGMPGMGMPGMGMGGMPGGMPSMQEYMQRIQNDPAMQQQLAQVMSDPQAIQQMTQMMQNSPQLTQSMQAMMSNPQAQASYEQMMGMPGGSMNNMANGRPF